MDECGEEMTRRRERGGGDSRGASSVLSPSFGGQRGLGTVCLADRVALSFPVQAQPV